MRHVLNGEKIYLLWRSLDNSAHLDEFLGKVVEPLLGVAIMLSLNSLGGNNYYGNVIFFMLREAIPS